MIYDFDWPSKYPIILIVADLVYTKWKNISPVQLVIPVFPIISV